jgi:AraC-like DNA-binding protein
MSWPYSQLSVRTYGNAPGGHAHAHFQVLWPLQGCLELEVEGRGMALKVGDGLLVRPGDRHDFESRQGSRCLVLDTDAPVWQHRSERPLFARSASQMAAFLAVALEEQLPLALESGAQLLAQSWGVAPARRAARRRIPWNQLTAWAAMRLHQRLLAADLADQVHLSESQFRARCLEEVGATPMQWLRQLRLNKARQLREAGLPVADICLQVGYESASALTAALRNIRSL